MVSLQARKDQGTIRNIYKGFCFFKEMQAKVFPLPKCLHLNTNRNQMFNLLFVLECSITTLMLPIQGSIDYFTEAFTGRVY